MQPGPSRKTPETLAKDKFFLLPYNHSRQPVDISLLSLFVVHRHVARATKKGGYRGVTLSR